MLKKTLILNLFLIGFAQAACQFILVNDSETPIFATSTDYGTDVEEQAFVAGTKIMPDAKASVAPIYIYEFDDADNAWKKSVVIKKESTFARCPASTTTLNYTDFVQGTKIKGLKIIQMSPHF